MRIAVLADIHGNLDALEAVLADVDRVGVDHIVVLGDHLSGPLDARGTAERLAALQATFIRGNHDRWLIETPPGQMGLSDRHAFDQLSPTHLDWLRQLPATAVLGGEVFLCHGTPISDTTYWLEEVLADGRARLAPRAEIERAAAGAPWPVLLCGHSHIPRLVHLADGRLVLNPGSVGLPGYDDDDPPHIMEAGSPAAAYAIIERHAGRWHPAQRWVPYDTDRMVALALAAERAEWARVLKTGWMTP